MEFRNKRRLAYSILFRAYAKICTDKSSIVLLQKEENTTILSRLIGHNAKIL